MTVSERRRKLPLGQREARIELVQREGRRVELRVRGAAGGRVGWTVSGWFDRYEKTHTEKHLRRSRDLYAEAFQLDPTSYYTGINVAAKSVLLGELNEARSIAQGLVKLVGTRPSPGDYWKTATAAEAQLILGNVRAAASLYRTAIAMDSEAVANHQSTRNQALRLAKALPLTSDHRQTLEAALRE